jgi:citrate synthase
MIELLKKAHKEAARRNNASTQVVLGSFQTNGNDLVKSIVAGLMTFGGTHAPIKDCYNWIARVVEYDVETKEGARMFSIMMNDILEYHEMNEWKLPGFGSAFVKGQPDPLLSDLCDATGPYYHIWSYVHDYFAIKGKDLWPNLAFYTALIAVDQKININFCEAEMIKARIEAWIELLQK